MRRLITALFMISAVVAGKGAAPPQAVPAAADPQVGPFGVYANLGRLVFEPNDNAPERVQIWGSFSVYADGPSVQLREGGYLYFRLSGPDDASAIRDWQALRTLYEDRPEQWDAAPGTHAFMKPGTAIRVRTRDEPPANPDVYVPGLTPARLSDDYGVPLNEMVVKPPHTVNYARVDEVVLSPAAAPQTIQIRGVFSLSMPDGSYPQAEAGYLYLSLPPDPQVRSYEWMSSRYRLGDSVTTAVRTEWNDWKAAAGQRQVVRFRRFAHQRTPIRIRPATEPVAAPDPYTPLDLATPFAVRADTLYRPVRALLDAP